MGRVHAVVRWRTQPAPMAAAPFWQRRNSAKLTTIITIEAAMIVVHHLNNSRSQRILWLLEELGLEYEIKRYQRDPKTMLAPPELKAVHPLGKSPVISDGDLVVAESGAIVEYLVEQYGQGRLKPAAGTPARLRYSHFLHYAEGSAMPPLLLKLVFDKVENSPMPFFVKPIARGIAQKVKGGFVLPQIALHLVHRRRIHGGRHPAQLPARGGRLARRARWQVPEPA
jgi:glutathione S-transferase